jgi:protein-tyrosine phosphatase
MAEALLRDRLEEYGLEGRASSAGLLYDEHPPSEGSVAALSSWGIDLSGHSSRQLRPEYIEQADLILGMARMHLREAAVMVRGCFPRTFTLKEFVRRANAVGPRGSRSMDEWLDLLGQGRRPVDLLGDDVEDDVVDPIGRPLAFYEKTADELSVLVDRMLMLVWTPAARKAIGG